MKVLLAFFLSIYISLGIAQDSSLVVKKRTKTVVYSSIGLYSLGLVGMNALWYKNSLQSSFHFFNDNSEWLQVDKVGHGYTAFHLSKTGVEVMKWTGIPERKAFFWGSMIGIIYQTPIEILDGFSSDFGASWGDLIANTTGAGLVYGQYSLWNELRIQPKYSFIRSEYASLRPNTLGSNILEEMLKDYNGQTYWLSFNIASLSQSSTIPEWLNVAIGYGGEEMIFAHNKDNQEIGLQPYRQYYLSLDLDVQRIKTRSKALKTILFFANAIKIPFPALEINKNGNSFHWLKF